MSGRFRIGAFSLAMAFLAIALPARAARPILDYHHLDAYFSLFASDSNVPWKVTTVRLDTYTAAPVDFAVYSADPRDVIVAGANTLPRSIDTRKRAPLARWRYTPPGGFRFQSNEVEVPIGSRQGFFVVEARRGNVAEQVWVNKTRIGLLSKETAQGVTVYGADLRSGLPIAHMRVSFLSHGHFADRFTNAQGIVRWSAGARPIFALAQWGTGFAFLSFLPQAPLRNTILALKVDTAVVHAGQTLRAIGFARNRRAGILRAASGDVHIALRSKNSNVTAANAHLDAAGAFSADLHIPADASTGDYAAIASYRNATAGAAVRVDANAGGLTLQIAPGCQPCAPAYDIPLVIDAERNGVPAAGVAIDVSVVRSPHVFPAVHGDPAAQWGVTRWYDQHVLTDSFGRAQVSIPHPSDGLPSTYGVEATAGGATADSRVVVPTSPIALQIMPDQPVIGSGTRAGFHIRGARIADGQPASGLSVRVQLEHATSIQEQTMLLDRRGQAAGAFSAPEIGTSLIVASAQTPAGHAMDAAQLQVEPQTMEARNTEAGPVALMLDRDRYSGGDDIRARADVDGAEGTAIFTLEGDGDIALREAPVHAGTAEVSFPAAETRGALAIGAAFVQDGSFQWTTQPVAVDAPGRSLSAQLMFDHPSYSPGTSAALRLDGIGAGPGTLIVRITRAAPTGSAVFDDAAQLLSIGTTGTQTSAAPGSWHPWVDANGTHALVEAFARRSAAPPDLTMLDAATASTYWRIDRQSANATRVPVPLSAGAYTVSLLKIEDDGRVVAASGTLVVQ